MRAAATWRYRVDVAARTAAASVGGYGVAVLVAIAATWTLPLARIDAAAIGTILALLAWPAVAMACFWARRVWSAWVGIVVTSALVGSIALAGGWRP